ncbi:NADH-quinone oxidoreductase subunit NuoG [Buchnera aphidicola]|uniref:NADH-quinone oxidoreductase subunit NuoG n=1 Tax=Buchnera aphidicola TaxID=9 RepID=UPI003463EFF5
MAQVYIDGKKFNLDPSYNLLQACLSAGLNIPYFCWHPLLGSLGACRQCAVIQYSDLNDHKGRLIMSCMTPVVDGSIISINNIEAQLFRKTIIELLLTNHPHDCPVCEEGGHCHLQDMTVMTQHNTRNYQFKKRTHKNQYLGDFIKHDMNRCIGCYRCVRYYQDYAGGTDFGVYGANNNIYFGRVEDGVLDNEHSGNLVEICPTGVFTDNTHSKRYNRKWDMQYAPGICHNCSIGCNISIGERYGEVRRIENRYHKNINHFLICDLGRFGYSYTNLNNRPRQPAKIFNGEKIRLNFSESINLSVNFLKRFSRIIGIGSTRSSIENNFSLKELVGKENFSHGMTIKEASCIKLIIDILKDNSIYTPSLKEIENYDIVLILGEDITQTAARMALAVRQSMKKKARDLVESYNIPLWNTAPIVNIEDNIKNSLYITSTHETKLDDLAKWSYYGSIHDQARFVSAIAHVLDSNLPPVLNLNLLLQEKAMLIAKELLDSKKVLIISGSNSFSTSIIKASFNIAKAIKKHRVNDIGLSFVTSSANALGVKLIDGMSIECALNKFQTGEADAIIFMEYDLYRHMKKDYCDLILKNKEKILTIDCHYTKTYKKSGLTLPAKSFVESSGTIVNFEGRAQRFFQVYDPCFYDSKNCIIESWKWLHIIKSKYKNVEESWLKLDDVISAYSSQYYALSKIQKDECNSSLRIHGQKIARSPNRYSGRTSLRSHIDVHEIAQPKDMHSMFAFSMEGNNQSNQSISHIPFVWLPGWNSPQALNKFPELTEKNLKYYDSGIYLFKDRHDPVDSYFNLTFDQAMDPKEWYVIPYYHLYGNEEMTQYSSVIQKNIPSAYALIGMQEALEMGLKKHSIVEFNCLNNNYCLEIRLSKYLNNRQIGLPIGRKNFPISLIGKKIKHLQEFTQ